MRKHLGVIGHDNLLREESSRGIINTDNDGLNKYKIEREQKLKLQKMISEHENIQKMINEHAADLADIKSMLVELLERNK